MPNSRWDKVRAFIHHGPSRPPAERTRWYRPLQIVWMAVIKFHRDFCFGRAAGLSFTTILSLIPIAVLFFSFAGMLGGGERIIAYVQEKVFPLVAPDFQNQLKEWLDLYISKSAFQEGPTGLVNVTAILGLVLAALGMMTTAERYLNAIWEADRRRSYFQKLTTFWVILTVSPFFLALSMWVGEFLIPKGGLIDRLQEEYWLLRTLYGFFVPLLIGFLGFSTVYLLLPATKVRPISAATGGLVAAVLWEFSRHAFFVYMQRQVNVTGFYPKLAAVPLFLVWIYLNWLITLFGAEVAHAHQHLERFLARRRQRTGEAHISLAALSVALLRRAHAAFRGEPNAGRLQIDTVAKAWDLPPEPLRHAAEFLQAKGFLVEDAKAPRTYLLACDPSQIALSEVVASSLAKEFPFETEPNRAAGAFPPTPEITRAWTAASEAFGPTTLAMLEPEALK